jgi:protein gp37
MGADSKIEWCDHTFNPWIGCTKVSPGCVHCYAEGESKRRGWAQWGKGKERHRTSASYWKQPMKWNREAEQRRIQELHSVPAGVPHNFVKPRVFCASLADWLDSEVPVEWLADLLALIHATPNLDWLLLTKRPENFRNRIGRVENSLTEPLAAWYWLFHWLHYGGAPENVWLGVSVEDQKRADERIPLLLETPAAVRFLSCEPLLGPVTLCKGCPGCPNDCGWTPGKNGYGIHWVIVGGESGPGARPMHPDWARSLRDQCIQADVPFFFKQWGEWVPADSYNEHLFSCAGAHTYAKCDQHGAQYMMRVGKKRAGRLLDDRSWNEFPTAHSAAATAEVAR